MDVSQIPQIKKSGRAIEYDGKVLYQPNYKQELFHASSAKFRLIGGAAGGGKSECILWEAFLQCLETNRPITGLLMRKTYPELEKTLIRRALEKFPQVLYTYNETKHIMKFPSTGSILEFGFCMRENDVVKFQCYSEDTEILTKENGFVAIRDVKEGDEVLSMNPATREMEWKKVSKTHKYRHKGKMYSYTGRFSMSFSVTENHKMLYRTCRRSKLKLREMKDCESVMLIPRTGRWEEGDIPDKTIFFRKKGKGNNRSYEFNTKAFLRFLGWYVSEGSTSVGRYQICLSQKKISEIPEVLDDLGVNWHFSRNNYSFNSRAIYEMLKPLGVSHEKYIPVYFKNLRKEYLEILFDALMKGDGTVCREGKKYTYVTNSPRLRDDVFEIALKLGYTATVWTQEAKNVSFPNGKSYFCREVYHLTLNKRKDTEVRKGNVSVEDYDGYVYCVTVPPHHTVFTRRNGRGMFCGQSSEYDFIGIDELTHMTEYVFRYLVYSRLRSAKEGVKPNFFAGTNPGGIGHLFCKKLWIDKNPDPSEYPDYRPEDYDFIPAKVWDNPDLINTDPDYIRRMQNLPENDRRALLEGDWDIFAGQFFESFRRDIHVVEPRPVLSYHKRLIGIDWGFKNPTAVLWIAVDEDGELYVYREFVQAGLNYKEIADMVIKLTGDERIDASVCDLNLWVQDGNVGKSGAEVVQEIFSKKNIPLIKADKERIAGWQQVREYLQPYKDIWGNPRPKLTISKNCHRVIETIPAMIYDTTKIEDMDTTLDDHCCDVLRYLIMFLTRVEAPDLPKDPTQKRFDELSGKNTGINPNKMYLT